MVRLVCRYPGGYPGSLRLQVWPDGESRMVDESVAEYLMSTFPSYFDRMMPAPAQRPLSGSAEVGDALAGPAGVLAKRLGDGELDHILGQLRESEAAGKCRATVLSRIDARARALAAGEGAAGGR